eukprot:GGOE01042268.1.p1 GENE.GGOE01042268.1~~GGOE01042268.1.p1  ORF type:complete len:279 (+),score=80.93 GGOE01042268.1:87-923(+)
MIVIETVNRIIYQLLLRKLDQPLVLLDERCGDFDHSAWHLLSRDNSTKCIVSLKLGGGVELLHKLGVKDLMAQVVPEVTLLPAAQTEANYHFSFQLDAAGATAELFTKVASLRRHVMALPFIVAFNKFEAGERFDPMVFNVREDESIELSATKDNVVVRYTLRFPADDDLVNAKILMQEFVDVKRHEKAVNAAPGVAWKFDEQKQSVICEFVVFKTHTNAKVRDRTIDRLLMFRTYVHYHLMCSKTYIHSRMRSRVEESIKVLNRAKTHTSPVVELIK